MIIEASAFLLCREFDLPSESSTLIYRKNDRDIKSIPSMSCRPVGFKYNPVHKQ